MTTENARICKYKETRNVKKSECPYSRNCGTCKNMIETYSKHDNDYTCFCTAVRETS